MATTSREAESSEVFKILTPSSLKELLTNAVVLRLPKPDKSLQEGNRLPEKLLKKFDPKTHACVPIQEIDPAYTNQKTYLVIGKNGTIHRYSARDSLSTFSPLSPVRKGAIFLTTHFVSCSFIVAVVVANIFFLVQEKRRIFDYTCIIIYALEMFLKILSRGFLLDPFSYMRNPWNWLDSFVIASSLIGPIHAVQSLQWIRVLKIIPLISEVKRSFQLITKSILKLKVAILLGAICTFFFSILGMELFMGVLTNRCIDKPDSKEISEYELQIDFNMTTNDTEEYTEEEEYEFTLNKYYSNPEFWFSKDICAQGSDDQCPQNYDCISGYGQNPNYGYTNFDSFFLSIMNTIRILDQDHLYAILNQITKGVGPMSLLFFIAIFFFGTYAIGTLSYSLISEYLFWVMENTGKFEEGPIEVNPEPEEDANNVNKGVTYIYTRHARDEYRIKAKAMIESFGFEVIMTTIILLDILALAIQHSYELPLSLVQTMQFFRIIVFIVYSIEFILRFYVDGLKGYFTNAWNVFDFAVLLDMTLASTLENYNLPIPFRMFKITPRWTTLGLLFRILFKCFKSLWGFVGLFFTLWAFFALVGFSLFGENYLENSSKFHNGEVPRWNFVDIPHSAMVVFRSWIGESVESLWDCLVVSDSKCLLYFPVIGFSGSLTIMILTIGVAFITEDILRVMETTVTKPSVLETMFCVPFTWIKNKCNNRRRKSITKPVRRTGSCDIVMHGLHLQRVTSGRTIATKPMGGSKTLKGISIFIICVASLVLIMDNVPNQPNFDIQSVIYAVDIVFTIFFFIMTIYNLVVVGVKECVTSPGFLFDLLVILEMVLNVIYDRRTNPHPYPMFFLFRSLRPFMLISRIDRLEVVVRGLLEELGFLRKYIVVGLFIRLFFAIMGTQMFGGGFSKCLDNEDGSLLNSTIISDKEDCLLSNYTWINSDFTFDHVGKSFVSLSLIGTRNSWITILHDTFDFRSPTMNFEQEFELKNFLYFLTFFIFGIFSVISVLFGVLYYNLKEFTGIFLTKEQTKSYQEEMRLENEKEILAIKILKPTEVNRAKVFDLISNPKFDIFVMSIIFLDNILLYFNSFEPFSSSYEVGDDHSIHNTPYIVEMMRLNIAFFYGMEMALKITGWGKQYFLNGWNCFDFVITIFCLIVYSCTIIFDLDPQSKIHTTADVLRIFRILRLFQFKPFMVRAKVLRGYFYAFSLAKSAVLNILIFQLMIMFSYCLMGMSKFGDVKLNKGLDYLFNFHTFSSSFRVLFMLSSYAGVGGIVSALTEEDNCTYGDQGTQGDCGDAFWGTLFVFSYLFLSFINFMNIYILFILEIVDQLEKNRREETAARALAVLETERIDRENAEKKEQLNNVITQNDTPDE